MTDSNKDKNSNSYRKHSKPERIAAMIGIVLLVLLYAGLIVEAFTMPADSGKLFMTAIVGTIAIPICVWLFIWAYGAMAGRHTVASLDAMTSDMDHDEHGNPVPKRPDGEIKTVVFDIGNVLIDFSWREMFAERGYTDEKMVERMAKASVYSPEWSEFDRGILTYDQIIDSFVKNDPEIEADLRKALVSMEGMATPKETTVPMLKLLKAKHYQILVLSNFSEWALDGNKETMSFLKYVDGGILSYRDKVIKPGEEIYRLLMSRYDLQPEECVFIDDTAPNIDTAVRLGMHGIVYKSQEQMLNELRALGVEI